MSWITSGAGVTVVGIASLIVGAAGAVAGYKQFDVADKAYVLQRQQFENEQNAKDAASKITFGQLPDAIPRCAWITGTAPIVDKQVLWIAHKSTRNEEVFLSKPSHRTDNQWSAEVTVGGATDAGKEYDLFAFYAKQEMSDYLQTLSGRARADDGKTYKGYAVSLRMPPGIISPQSKKLTRDMNAPAKSC